MKKRCFRYTMVEMLVVIVLATILFSIGIPAFLTMIRGNAMTIAVRELSACLQGTRSYAATNNTYTAVLFLSNELDSVDKNKGYSRYRVCTVNRIETSDEYYFEGWIEGENWKTLPSGILMGQKTGADAYKFQNGLSVKGVSLKDLTDEDGYGSVVIPRALIFKPNGQTVNSELSIPLFHERNLNGTFVYTDQQDGKTVCQVIKVNQFSGKVTVEEIQQVQVSKLTE